MVRDKFCYAYINIIYFDRLILPHWLWYLRWQQIDLHNVNINHRYKHRIEVMVLWNNCLLFFFFLLFFWVVSVRSLCKQMNGGGVEPPAAPGASTAQKPLHDYKLLVDPALVKGGIKLYRYDGIVPNDLQLTVHTVKDPRNEKFLRLRQRLDNFELPVPRYRFILRQHFTLLLHVQCMCVSQIQDRYQLCGWAASHWSDRHQLER